MGKKSTCQKSAKTCHPPLSVQKSQWILGFCSIFPQKAIAFLLLTRSLNQLLQEWTSEKGNHSQDVTIKLFTLLGFICPNDKQKWYVGGLISLYPADIADVLLGSFIDRVKRLGLLDCSSFHLKRLLDCSSFHLIVYLGHRLIHVWLNLDKPKPSLNGYWKFNMLLFGVEYFHNQFLLTLQRELVVLIIAIGSI